MSQLFLASDMDVLAGRLLDEIASRQKSADLFEPISIVVPNRFVQQWLKFRIAREWGVAINLEFSYLEQALWNWLVELDPRTHARPPEMLDGDRYQLLVLSILLYDTDPALQSVQAFFEKGTALNSRLACRRACRRAWQLAGRLGSLIRDYEYHRQDSIIQHWLSPASDVDVPASWREREAVQRTVFRAVIDEPAGRRALLNRVLGRNFKTLPQYVMEFVHEIKEYRTPKPRLIHLFGLSQISPLHMQALELLGQFHDWRIYHFNPLASRLPSAPKLAALRKLANSLRSEERLDARPGTELLHIWGRAGAESLDLTAGFLRNPRFHAAALPCPKQQAAPPTVLSRLHDIILDGEPAHERVPQDVSLQIVRCPGIWREAEMIHAGILNSLQHDPALQQTDIAVLVSDMDIYRPVLMAVFERPPRLLSFGLADYSAARASTFGQALVGMLDLALENLSRSRVFEVLLNPCILAKQKVDREAALHWLKWADDVGIYHGWDAAEKKEQGYAASPLYSWKLGLQRLRLGHYMNVVADDHRAPAPQWQGIVPFADVESGDREQLDQFCRVVEGMLPMLVRLRGMTAPASTWSEAIISLMQRFLATPDDRPEEELVRQTLLYALQRLAEWDALHGDRNAPLSLAMVREYVVSQLENLAGRRRDVLSSGITIAALQPQRPLPFKVIVLAGMGELHFPGGAAASPFDLRQVRRQPGDILPVEQSRYAFLEAILSAKQKLVITYNARDLQKDEDLQPSIPVVQLQRFVAKHIVQGGEFRPVTVPLVAHDALYLDSARQPAYQDCLVQVHRSDRLLAFDAAERAGQLSLTLSDKAELDEARQCSMSRYSGSEPLPREARPMPTVSLVKLRKFLENPAAAALRYHLRADDEWDEGREHDFEPLVSPKYAGNRLVTQTLQRVVLEAEEHSVAELTKNWPEMFARKYQEWTQRSLLPDGAFATVDAEVLKAQVESGLTDGGVFAFLERQTTKTWCGPYAFGESETPLGAKRRAPALVVPMSRSLAGFPDGQIRLVGAWPFAWRDEASLDLLIFHAGKLDPKKPLSRGLFEPLLFVIALAALGELGDRAVTLHLVQPEGVIALSLCRGLLSQDQARGYLSELATDFVDVSAADQLPFAILQEKEWLTLYQDEMGANLDAELLDNWRCREADGYWGFHCEQVNTLTSLGFRVPDDAGAKLRRRFRPLHLLLPPADPAPKKPRGRKVGGSA